MNNYEEIFNPNQIAPWYKIFQRNVAAPLDRSSMFSSLEDAEKYAKGDKNNPDSRGLQGTSYVGQIISVYEENTVSIYKIDVNRDLKPIGGGVETVTAETYTNAIELSQTLSIGQLIKVNSKEEIGESTYQSGFYIVDEPGKISALSTSTGSDDEIGALKTRVDELEETSNNLGNSLTSLTETIETSYATKAYVQEEIKNIELLTIVSELPTENIDSNKIYAVPSPDSGETNVLIEYIYIVPNDESISPYWEEIGRYTTSVSAENFYTKEETNSLLNGKLSNTVTINGKSFEEEKLIITSEDVAIGKNIGETYESGSTVYQVLEDIDTRLDNVGVKISKEADNAVVSKNDGIYVKNLENRLTALESILSGITKDNLITTDNISNHAVTSITSVDDDLEISSEKGNVQLNVVSISNITFTTEDITK